MEVALAPIRGTRLLCALPAVCHDMLGNVCSQSSNAGSPLRSPCDSRRTSPWSEASSSAAEGVGARDIAKRVKVHEFRVRKAISHVGPLFPGGARRGTDPSGFAGRCAQGCEPPLQHERAHACARGARRPGEGTGVGGATGSRRGGSLPFLRAAALRWRAPREVARSIDC